MKRKVTAIFLLAAAIFFAGCSGKGTGHPDITVVKALEGEQAEAARELTAKCVARLDIERDGIDCYGSALLWDVQEDSLILASAGHLLEQGNVKGICFPGNGNHEIIINSDKDKPAVRCSITSDIGFVEIPLEWIGQEELKLVSLHQRIFNTIDAYSPLHLTASSMTYAGDLSMEAVLLEKSSCLPEWNFEVMVVQCETEQGMSGSGIFDDYGHLVGMVLGGNGTNTAVLSMEKINQAYQELYGLQRDTQHYN